MLLRATCIVGSDSLPQRQGDNLRTSCDLIYLIMVPRLFSIQLNYNYNGWFSHKQYLMVSPVRTIFANGVSSVGRSTRTAGSHDR